MRRRRIAAQGGGAPAGRAAGGHQADESAWEVSLAFLGIVAAVLLALACFGSCSGRARSAPASVTVRALTPAAQPP